MIEITNCAKIYRPNHIVLKNVNLTIKQGEMVALVGASGTGKSTLMNIIGMIDYMTEGTYLFEGQQVNKLNNKSISKLRNWEIGFIFQSYYLIPKLTVYQNLDIPLSYAKTPIEHRDDIIERVLRKLRIKSLIHHKVDYLSGGEKQRVAIARALINSPRVLIADEPTGNLDDANMENVMAIFKDIHQEGMTIIIVTHDMNVANRCDVVYELNDGELMRVTQQRSDLFEK